MRTGQTDAVLMKNRAEQYKKAWKFKITKSSPIFPTTALVQINVTISYTINLRKPKKSIKYKTRFANKIELKLMFLIY